MQNMSMFSQQYMYSVEPVYYVNQGSIVGGKYIVLRNSNRSISHI